MYFEYIFGHGICNLHGIMMCTYDMLLLLVVDGAEGAVAGQQGKLFAIGDDQDARNLKIFEAKCCCYSKICFNFIYICFNIFTRT